MIDKLLAGALQQTLGGKNTQDPLLAIVADLLSDRDGGGGLAGLIRQFQQAGLGEQIQSWVGRGQNLPVSVDQLMQVFGAGQMQQLASRAGLDRQELGPRLAELLPQIVDRLTPDGQVPSGGIEDALGMLSKLLPR